MIAPSEQRARLDDVLDNARWNPCRGRAAVPDRSRARAVATLAASPSFHIQGGRGDDKLVTFGPGLERGSE
jgi:hypothetical protein